MIVNEDLTVNGKVTVNLTGDGVPFQVIGNSAWGGGTIQYCMHHTDDPEACAEFTGYRTRGTPQSQLDCQPGDELLKYAAVGKSEGRAQQAGYMQFEAGPGWGSGAPAVWRLAVSPPGSDVPKTIAFADHEYFEVKKWLLIPNNTMLMARRNLSGVFGMMYMDTSDRTSLQLNHRELRLSDAKVVTDAQGNITGIRAIVNGIPGTIPFNPD